MQTIRRTGRSANETCGEDAKRSTESDEYEDERDKGSPIGGSETPKRNIASAVPNVTARALVAKGGERDPRQIFGNFHRRGKQIQHITAPDVLEVDRDKTLLHARDELPEDKSAE